MINISNIISNHIRSLENVITLESLYQFDFNPAKVPVRIIFPIKKNYQNNLALKTGLHNAWMRSPLNTKGDIIEYYIKTINVGINAKASERSVIEMKIQNNSKLANIMYNLSKIELSVVPKKVCVKNN